MARPSAHAVHVRCAHLLHVHGHDILLVLLRHRSHSVRRLIILIYTMKGEGEKCDAKPLCNINNLVTSTS